MDTFSPQKTILIVEDDEHLSSMLAERLSEDGYEVVLAENGVEGLKKIKEKRPDLILLDIIMPRMDGMTMLEKMKERGLHTIPTILLTNLSDNRMVAESLHSGVYNYLVKSDWKLSDVIRKIEGILQKKKR